MEEQKVERVGISKQTLKLLNNSGYRIISKTVTLYDVLTRQESRLWVFEDDPTPTTTKKTKRSYVCCFL